MKLTLTTAIAATLIATGAFAESRGADNETGSEVAAEPTQNDTTRTQAEIDATEDEASRGAGNMTAEEAAENPVIDDDEVAGTKDSEDEASRGADNTTGGELVEGEDKTDG